MAQDKRLNRKMETVIGFTALAALVCVVAAILLMQGKFDLERFGVKSSTAAGAGAAKAAIFSVSDMFVVFSDAEHYGTDTLYEKINGKAPLYTDAGFEMLDTQRFTFKDNPQCWLEIYRYTMSTPQAAFYVYSTQKRPAGIAIDGISPEHGYKTTSGMYLAAGKNYFEISASAEDEGVLKALTGCIKDIAELGKEENKYLELPKTFPAEGAVAGTFKMYLNTAFGIDGLGTVYVRDYIVDGQRLSAFVIEDGKTAMAKYSKFMEENGEKVDDADGIITYDLYGVYEIMGLAGDYLAGVHETDDAKIGREFVKTAINSLRDKGN